MNHDEEFEFLGLWLAMIESESSKLSLLMNQMNIVAKEMISAINRPSH